MHLQLRKFIRNSELAEACQKAMKLTNNPLTQQASMKLQIFDRSGNLKASSPKTDETQKGKGKGKGHSRPSANVRKRDRESSSSSSSTSEEESFSKIKKNRPKRGSASKTANIANDDDTEPFEVRNFSLFF